jgi:hypothetical protein
MEQYEHDLKAYLKLDEIEAIVEGYGNISKYYKEVNDSIETIDLCIKDYINLDRQITRGFNVELLQTSLDELECCIEDVEQLDGVCDEITSILECVEEIDICLQEKNNVIQLNNGKLNTCLKLYEDELHKMKKCPWCGQTIDEKVVRFKKNGLVN